MSLENKTVTLKGRFTRSLSLKKWSVNDSANNFYQWKLHKIYIKDRRSLAIAEVNVDVSFYV